MLVRVLSCVCWRYDHYGCDSISSNIHNIGLMFVVGAICIGVGIVIGVGSVNVSAVVIGSVLILRQVRMSLPIRISSKIVSARSGVAMIGMPVVVIMIVITTSRR